MKKADAMRNFPALHEEDFLTLFKDENGFYLTEELRQRAYSNAQRNFNARTEAERRKPLEEAEKKFRDKIWEGWR